MLFAYSFVLGEKRKLKKGDFVTFKPYSNPKESQVYIFEGYDRSLHQYELTKFSDFCSTRFVSSNKELFTDFTF